MIGDIDLDSPDPQTIGQWMYVQTYEKPVPDIGADKRSVDGSIGSHDPTLS